MDRTEALYERCEAAAPYYDEAWPSRLEIADEVRSRERGVLSSSFHRRALALVSSLDQVKSVLSPGGRGRGGASSQADHLEVAAIVKEVGSKVQDLQREVGFAEEGKKPGRGGHGKAHKVGVVVILTTKLKEIGDMQKRSLGRQVRAGGEAGEEGKRSLLWSSRKAVPMPLPPAPRRLSGPGEETTTTTTSTSPFLQLQQENAVLLSELEATSTQASEVHRTLVEISNLNQVFSEQIQEQSEQLESLYEEALATTVNFEKGNVELAKALKYNKEGGRYIICIILFFTFALLFLDWWQG